MSVETQEPLTSQNFNQSQGQSQPFNQTDYYLHSQQQQQSFSSHTGSFNFYGSYRLQSEGYYKNKDANENTNAKGDSKSTVNEFEDNDCTSSSHVEPFQSLDNPKSSTPEELYTKHTASPTKKFNSSQNEKCINNKNIDESNHSPLSSTSLSDSEVPDKQDDPESIQDINKDFNAVDHNLENNSDRRNSEKKSEIIGQKDGPFHSRRDSSPQQGSNYYKNYLQRYAENFVQKADSSDCTSEKPEVKKEPGELSKDNSKEDSETSDETPKKPKKPGEIAQLEEAVKKNLDEAIRQHHSRITQPVTDHSLTPKAEPQSPNTSVNPILSSPYNQSSNNNPFNQSPRALPSHVRHLNFSNISPPSSSQPLSASSSHSSSTPRDFPLLPRDPRLGIPPVFPTHLPPSPSVFSDLIQRSRANTVPTTELKRSRSDSFSSLPEHHLGIPGSNLKRSADGKEFYYCHLCSYVGNSEVQFNAHMNTHFEHQCPHCDYKSRTEGRLKRHIKDFHSEENPDDFTGGRMIRNNPTKPKIFRCRQCEFAATDKEEYWKHARSHIKDDKCLQCPKCPFVTEYKHHLEYHLRNHFGSKPFKCNKCNYSCVNKSMLNSHMKSHTNVYQYRCQDCTYATKYCHSLKLHLSKYNHQPATVLNNDGSLPVDGSGDFDLVSKRGPPRGPRLMKHPDGGPPSLEVIDRNLLAMHTNMAATAHNPLSGMAAMMGTFWSNGLNHPLPPPPLIPVSGLTPLSIQVPGQERKIQLSPSSHTGGAEVSPKCRFCDFSSDNPHILADHVMKNHGNEHKELFKMFGFRTDSGGNDDNDLPIRGQLEQDMRMRMLEQMKTPPNAFQDDNSNPFKGMNDFEIMRAKYSKNGSSRSSESSSSTPGKTSPNTPSRMNGYANDRSSSCSPTESPDYHDSMEASRSDQHSAKLARSLADQIEREAIKKRGGECPLDLTNGKLPSNNDSDAENESISKVMKRKWDDLHSEDEPRSNPSPQSEDNEDIRNNSPNNRKRSRKGKAYKLDMISIKLQEKNEGGENYDMDDEEEDHDLLEEDYQNTEGDDDRNNTQSEHNEVDYSDITKQLRELNGETVSPDPSLSTNVNSISTFSSSINRKKLLFDNTRERENERNGRKANSNTSFKQYGQGNLRKQDSPVSQEVDNEEENSGDSSDWSKYECQHCGIAFRDCIMYTMHMGYHGFQNPFTCNRCGQTTKDRVEFFLHIARKAHA